jgi:hypothetical protein
MKYIIIILLFISKSTLSIESLDSMIIEKLNDFRKIDNLKVVEIEFDEKLYTSVQKHTDSMVNSNLDKKRSMEISAFHSTMEMYIPYVRNNKVSVYENVLFFGIDSVDYEKISYRIIYEFINEPKNINGNRGHRDSLLSKKSIKSISSSKIVKINNRYYVFCTILMIDEK